MKVQLNHGVKHVVGLIVLKNSTFVFKVTVLLIKFICYCNNPSVTSIDVEVSSV